MKHSSDLVVDADAATIVNALEDLATYPHWNDLVSAAVATEQLADDPGPAWLTTLRAQVGPFARSKQLRFVRDDSASSSAAHDHHLIRFVRRETDDRVHAEWLMEVEVAATTVSSSTVTLTLQYGGALWVPALGTILRGAIERATTRLPAYLEASTR